MVAGVGAPIAVTQKPVGSKPVVVGRLVGCADGDGYGFEDLGFPDPLLPNQTDPVALVAKTMQESGPGQYIVKSGLLLQPLKDS
jgi:hypothetical protein